MRCGERLFSFFSFSFTVGDQPHQGQRRGRSIIPRLSYLLNFLLVVLQSPAFVYASDQELISYVENLIRNNTFIYSRCSTSVDGISQTYGQNLEQLFSSLVDSVSNTGFSNTSVGEAPNTAYGLALCLGYVPADICRNCTAVAVERVKVDCPNDRSAMIWLAPCLLRFSDTRFFGSIGGNEKVRISPKESTKSADPAAARNFLNLLARDAANDPNMYATKIQQMDGFTSYGMAQCTRDLTLVDCMLCLQNATKQIEIENNNTEERPWRFLSASCAMGYDTRLFFLTSQVPPSPSHPERISDNDRRRKRMIAIISSTVGILLLAIGIFVMLSRSRKRKNFKEELRRYRSELASLGNLTEVERNHDLPQYSLKALQAATNNFSEENKLGRGGFGPVYKGCLNGRLVAVKRLSERSGQGLKEFMNEVVLIAKLQHKNLVRLLGYCIDRGEKMLIYEFMPNGSLDAFFYDPQKRESLDWEKRFNIIVGSARGILYLHQDSRLNIIHRDLKAGNVLLDEQMIAKISDFGMARIFSGDKDPRSTNIIVGTQGYMAPEYAIDGQFSIKSDVYSFGVLLLEIVSGQAYSGFHLFQIGCTLTGYAWTLWSKGRMSELIDPVLRESAATSQILKCFHIGLLCVQEDPANRPTMSGIINMLESDSPILPTPQQPPLVFSSSISNSSTSMTGKNGSSKSASTNSESSSRLKHSFR
ncbi:cysteine-rich receptor-like protein kinase 19 [Nymphaea colorata]|nr:cysteine-rich receptor-like protein kinase 19 [Nymphaea colorata]